MKILVLGVTGMLGSAVYRRMQDLFGPENVTGTYKNAWSKKGKLSGNFWQFHCGGMFKPYILKSNYDYVINCIGKIKPEIDESDPVSVKEAVLVNSVFPRELAAHCQNEGIKLIHVSTDCVFSGEVDNCVGYTEIDIPDPQDVYGRSKALGECPEDCMVLRTSVIGEELGTQKSLIEWVKSQDGKEVNGYLNHLWSGLTSLQFADCCTQIMTADWWNPGLFHLFTKDPVTKYDLLGCIAEAFDIDLKINPVNAGTRVNRSLNSFSDLNDNLNISTILEQFKLLEAYSIHHNS
jgi:dTDP-4-dehydrorhamnose reductase